MDYAKRIYELRKKADISQEALAAAIGTTRQQVSRWECGAAIPSSKYVCALSDYFGISANELFGEEIEITKEDIQDKTSFHFRNLALVLSGLLLFIYFSAVLLSYFSQEIATCLLYLADSMRNAGVDYDSSAVNSSIRALSEAICATALAWVILSVVLIFAVGLLLFFRHFSSSKNKIARSEYLGSFLILGLFSISVLVAGCLQLTIGQHVGYLSKQTFGLFDGALFLFGSIFAADVIISFLRIILRKQLGKRMVLRPWGKTRKTLEIFYVVFGAIIFSAFVALGTSSYAGFAIVGLIYFPTATILVLLHFCFSFLPRGASN